MNIRTVAPQVHRRKRENHAVHHRPRRLGAVAVACLLAAGTTTATADAAKKPTAKSVDKKVAKTNKTLSKTRKSLSRTQANLKKTDASLSAASTQIGAAAARLSTAEGQLAGILAAAPQLATGLQTLATALQDQVRPALTQLGEAVQTTIPNAIKDNVTKLAGSGEYGVIQPLLGATAIPGALLTSPNIPDDFNGSTLTGTAIIPVPDSTNAAPITLQSAVRSGESDGTGADLPAAHVSLVTMTVAPSANVTVGGGNGTTGLPLTSKPNAALGGLPFYPVNVKSPLVDAATAPAVPNPLNFPTGTGQNTDITDAAVLNSGGKYTLTNSSGAAGFATITYTVRFLDLSPSTTDLTA